MPLNSKLLQTVRDGEILEVMVGLHWTAVLAEVEGDLQCGLASTLQAPHDHHGVNDVTGAGSLTELSAHDLTSWSLNTSSPVQKSIGMAALNALLPKPGSDSWIEANAEKIITEKAAGGQVAIIGDFPFISRLRPHVDSITVIDRSSHAGVLPEDAAKDVLPRSDFIAITGMAAIDQSLEGLLALCPDDSIVMVLGPSTPLSPVLFDYGVDYISGSIVIHHEAVLRTIAQGANFRQVHRAGVQLVTMERNPGATLSLLTPEERFPNGAGERHTD